jgi:hypothetical protein
LAMLLAMAFNFRLWADSPEALMFMVSKIAIWEPQEFYRASGEPTMLLRRPENDPAISFTLAL